MNILKAKTNLRIIMAQKGIKSLKDVQDLTKLSKPTLKKIADNEDIRNVELGSLFTICEKLNCNFNELLVVYSSEDL